MAMGPMGGRGMRPAEKSKRGLRGVQLELFSYSERIKLPMLIALVAFVPLSPYPDRLFFFGWQAKARQIVFALQFIPKTVVFIINVLVHLEILQYNIFAHMSQFPDCHLFL